MTRTVTKMALYGDSVGWTVFAIDLTNDPLKVAAVVPTGLGPYPVDRVSTSTLFAVTRGERSVTWIDLPSLTPLGTIPLVHKPRSAFGNAAGLVLVSGADQPRTSVIDLAARRVRLTVGAETDDRVEDFGGSLASGHELWLPDLADGTRRFFVLDRIRRKVTVYRYPDGTKLWNANTPTAVHHVLPDKDDSKRWYATCEGNQRSLLAPAIMMIRETRDNVFVVEAVAPLPVDGADLVRAGGHHVDEHPTNGRLYVGSNEGYVYVFDKARLGSGITAKIPTGAGCGHTRFTTFDGKTYAVTINHLAKHISVIDTATETKVADIEVTSAAPATPEDKTQGHTTKVYQDQPHLFYMMASMDATLCEVDLQCMKVSRTVELRPGSGDVKPLPLQGTFI